MSDQATQEIQWFYGNNGEKAGPFSENDFINLIKNGTVTKQTLVWNATFTDWVALEKTTLNSYATDVPPIPSTPNVQSQTQVTTGKKVSKVAYILCAIFLGGLGVHKFLEGKTLMGILYIILTCLSILVLPAIILLILIIIDIIRIASKPSDDHGDVTV